MDEIGFASDVARFLGRMDGTDFYRGLTLLDT